jgi:branched-chain amino acid transport system permease protein
VLQTKGVPMPAAGRLAAPSSPVFAAALGRAILHLRGHYFAIASLVVAEVLREITNSATDLTGGGMGLNLPVLSLDVTAQARLFYYAMFVAAAAALATTALVAATAWDSVCAAFSRTKTRRSCSGSTRCATRS